MLRQGFVVSKRDRPEPSPEKNNVSAGELLQGRFLKGIHRRQQADRRKRLPSFGPNYSCGKEHEGTILILNIHHSASFDSRFFEHQLQATISQKLKSLENNMLPITRMGLASTSPSACSHRLLSLEMPNSEPNSLLFSTNWRFDSDSSQTWSFVRPQEDPQIPRRFHEVLRLLRLGEGKYLSSSRPTQLGITRGDDRQSVFGS